MIGDVDEGAGVLHGLWTSHQERAHGAEPIECGNRKWENENGAWENPDVASKN